MTGIFKKMEITGSFVFNFCIRLAGSYICANYEHIIRQN